MLLVYEDLTNKYGKHERDDEKMGKEQLDGDREGTWQSHNTTNAIMN